MKTLSDLKKRLATLEAKTGRNSVTFTMPDYSTRKILNSRLLEVFRESLADDGIKSADFETVITSVGNNADHKLVTLFQMCID